MNRRPRPRLELVTELEEPPMAHAAAHSFADEVRLTDDLLARWRALEQQLVDAVQAMLEEIEERRQRLRVVREDLR